MTCPNEREAIDIAFSLVRRRGLQNRYVESTVKAVIRKGHCTTPKAVAEVAVERLATTARRLSHETGAENWA